MRSAAIFFPIAQFFLAGLAFSQNPPPFPGAFRFQDIQLTGITNFSHFIPSGINDQGDIAGKYFDNSTSHGFIRTAGGTVTTFDVPGAVSTQPTAINNSGQIVGIYYTDSTGTSKGFLRQANGTFAFRTVPGASNVELYGINNQGRSVGSYDGHAVIFESDGSFNFFDLNPPNRGTVGGVATGINDAGIVVGKWTSSTFAGGIYGCFQRDAAGVLTYPANCTSLTGINNAGNLIATDDSPPGIYRSNFLRDATDRRVYSSAPPASSDTFPRTTIMGVNQLNGIVGSGPTNIPFSATPCPATIAPSSQTISAAGGNVTVQVTTDAGCTWGAGLPWGTIFVDSMTPFGTGSGTFTVQIPAYTASTTPRSETIWIAGNAFTLTQSGATCAASFIGPANTAVSAAGGSGFVSVSAPEGCSWTATSNSPWVVLTKASGVGNDTITFTVGTNASASARTATLTLNGGTFFINQAGSQCTYTVVPGTTTFPTTGGSLSVAVTTTIGCGWFASSGVPWITTPNGVPVTATNSLTFSFTIGSNAGGAPRSATINVAGTNINVTQDGDTVSGLGFIAVPPCRLVDTRPGEGKTGAFGPPFLAAGSTRDIPVPTSTCNIPATARAYAMNVTVVPRGPLSFLTMYPTGQSRPNVSTLNAFQGQIIANAAIVPAGTNGSLTAFVTDSTDLIIDINGYFTDPAAQGTLVFYPMTPCRVIDTRVASAGPAGAFGPPALASGQERSFPIRSSACNISPNAGAYVFNITVVPSRPLDYITAWPTGGRRPLVSVQNSPAGHVLANAAIVPAGTNGDISLFAPQTTDVVVDINGYFAPPGQAGGLKLYTVTPCRLADTRAGSGFTGSQGPPALIDRTARIFGVARLCNVSSAAKAFSLNVTVVPPGYLGFVTLYPGPVLPFASTLNAWEGQIAANAAIVPAEVDGGVYAYVSNATNIILDINGYFAP